MQLLAIAMRMNSSIILHKDAPKGHHIEIIEIFLWSDSASRTSDAESGPWLSVRTWYTSVGILGGGCPANLDWHSCVDEQPLWIRRLLISLQAQG